MQLALKTTDWRIPLLFQKGVKVQILEGQNAYQVVTNDFLLEPDYLEKHIEAVFLEGYPLDDLTLNHVKENNRLVLADGLPGISGICMRRKSPLKEYRATISQETMKDNLKSDMANNDETLNSQQKTATPQYIQIELALLGLAMKNLYPHFFKKGVYLEVERLKELIETAEEQDYQTILLDNKKISLNELKLVFNKLENSDLIKILSL